MGRRLMEYSQGLMAQLAFGDEMLLLWVAIAIGVLFIGLLVLDRVTGGGRRRHHHREPETLGAKLRKPFTQMWDLQADLRQMFRERSRRRHGRGRRPPAGLR